VDALLQQRGPYSHAPLFGSIDVEMHHLSRGTDKDIILVGFSQPFPTSQKQRVKARSHF